ncbi:uncharacterized protein PGRI_023590 [Penicillium griseofulvum]|uniref:Mid2-like cell wall stress sensor n=1 Tax=Penicillium patulum TaxID=5078 RepID=A0A135LHQ4_PENPA|nr:uncharacterized protein PGRI_023590 [Penicillium griseofulvum]KXG48489.1 hypothetical protein PGRI_023590 [Penicillium griseofulvum]
MRSSIFTLCTVLCSRVLGHPYVSEITWNSATTSVENSWPVSQPSEVAQLYGKRGYGEILQARDTTTTAESTASTTDTTTSEKGEETSSETTTSESTTSETTTETTSEATTSTTESTTSPTSETTTETTSSSTPTSTSSTTSSSSVSASASVTTITSTSTSSPSTTATDTATTTPTSMTAAELAEWNHRGNIAAIAFGCCFISVFMGVAIVYYACGKAKARRIAASKLSNSSQSYSKIPLAAIKEPPSTDLEVNRSYTAYTNHPQTHYSPAGSVPGSAPSVSNYSDTPSAVSAITADRSSARGHISRTHQ